MISEKIPRIGILYNLQFILRNLLHYIFVIFYSGIKINSRNKPLHREEVCLRTAAKKGRSRHFDARFFRIAPLALVPFALSGCDGFTVLNPHGQIGMDERSIIYLATGLMLIVVVPVIVMTFLFAWRYRASNTNATYAPDWSHSNKIEAVVWLVPCVIVAVLATVTWTSSHELDPYKPIASAKKPITIEAVSMNWKWLFIYPDLHIATVGQIAIPKDVPVNFHLTSDSAMNSFFIPQLGGQVYTMVGMQTKLSLIANKTGTYDGMSANFSGGGFSDMKFKTLAVTPQIFKSWVAKVKASSKTLDVATYKRLAKPSENNPVTYFSTVDPNLYHDILHKCFIGSGSDCRVAEAKE